MAENLNLSKEKSEKLLSRLQAIELVLKKENEYCLSDAGRSYALRVIRMHRIWERYLADETGVKDTEWHTQADFLEHKISDDEIDKIAAQIGNPVFDPHGDPIPTSDGDLPKYRGKTFEKLSEGDIARIIHIEDEPVEVYQQLSAEGLYPGM